NGNGLGDPSSIAPTAAWAVRHAIDMPCPVNPPQNHTDPGSHAGSASVSTFTGPISGRPSGENPIAPDQRETTLSAARPISTNAARGVTTPTAPFTRANPITSCPSRIGRLSFLARKPINSTGLHTASSGFRSPPKGGSTLLFQAESPPPPTHSALNPSSRSIS